MWTQETFTASDGYRWHYRRYPAVGAARGEIVCLHGIQSHAGWYEHCCQRLADAGFNVSFLDRRGSGTNTEARGDAPSFRRLLDDIAEFLRAPSPLAPRPLPRFLVAISWGGKLAAALQARHPGLVDGLVLVCPGFCARVRPSFGQRLAIFFSRLVQPTRRFPIPLNDPELFTANPRWIAFLRDDPLALHEATARLLVVSVRLDVYVRWNAGAVRAPVLLLLAGKDRIIDNARTRALAARFSGPLEVIEYPEAHHTLEFEPNPEPFLADLIAWLERRLTGSASAGFR